MSPAWNAWRRLWCCGALVAVACGPATPPLAGSPPSLRLPHLAQPRHYTLAITPDLPKATFSGRETIDVDIVESTSRIVIHAVEITFGDTHIDAGGRTQTATVTLDPASQTATLTVPAPIAPGPARISLVYTGILNDELRGLYLSQANGRRYAVSQLEATDARRMFPSFDEPAMKATFDLSVTIDTSDHAISNGAVVSDVPGPAPGTHTVTFATTPKMSSYLLALVVGDFECAAGSADDVPIRVCATPDKKALTGLALESAQDILRFYNRYFAIKYPYKKLDVVAVPDFAAGAMENTAAIFYRERSLLADPAQASLAIRKRIMTVLAHEMAHQWFGDLVTMQWWDDIWLNEGFANWMETKPVRALKPEWHSDLDEVESNVEAMDIDRLASTRAIRSAADTPDEISEAFDAIAYNKGAAVLRMVESYVGEQAFRDGINAYLSKFQYANAAAEDFWTTMASATGKPVDRVMPGFVGQPGVPLVTIRASCTGSSTEVRASQERYQPLGGKPLPVQGPWQIPLCVRSTNAGGSSACQLFSSPAQTFTLPGCATTVVANAGAAGYYLTAYDAAAVDRLTKDVARLSGPERVLLPTDVWAAVQAGRSDAGAFLIVASTLASDSVSAVVDAVVGPVHFIGRYLVSDDTAPRYRAWVQRAFAGPYRDLGWIPAPREPDDRRARRAAVIRVLGDTGGDVEVRAHATRLIDGYLNGTGIIDPTLLDTVTMLAALDGDAALYERYLARFRAATAPEDRDRFLHGLAQFREPALVRRTIDLTLSTQVRTQDAASLASIALSSAIGRSEAWPLVRDRWVDLSTKVDSFFGTTNVVSALGSFCDPAAAAELRDFFRTHKASGADRTLQQSLESIETCVAVRERQAPTLASALR